MDFNTETYARNFLNKFKQTMHVPELTIGELHAILRETGIRPLRKDENGHEVYPKYQLNELLRSDREFFRCYHIVKEKSKQQDKRIITTYRDEDLPEMSDMERASDELLRQQEVYYDLRESKIEDDFKKFGITKKYSKNSQGYKKIEYNFGKNGKGLTQELCVIAKDIEQETKKPFYLCEPHFDILDDVYSFTVVTQDKAVNESVLNENELMIYSYIDIPVLYSTYRCKLDNSTPNLSNYQFGYLSKYQKLDHDFLIVTAGEGFPCEFAKSVIPFNRFFLKKQSVESWNHEQQKKFMKDFYTVDDTYEMVNHLVYHDTMIDKDDVIEFIKDLDKKNKSVTESLIPLNEGISGYKPYDSDEFMDEAARIGEEFTLKLIDKLKNASDHYWKYVYMGMIIDFLKTRYMSWGTLYWEEKEDPKDKKRLGMRLREAFYDAYE